MKCDYRLYTDDGFMEGTVPKLAVIENIVTICATAAIVLGGLALGGGGWSFLGLLLMLNLSCPKLT